MVNSYLQNEVSHYYCSLDQQDFQNDKKQQRIINIPQKSYHSEPCCSSQTSSSTELTLCPFSSSCLTSIKGSSLKSKGLETWKGSRRIRPTYLIPRVSGATQFISTYIIHLVLEADVDFIAFGQRRLKLVKLLAIQGQL